ncbi:MAG: ribose 5-phosphate isomerase B [Bacteroidia bacterium]
MIIALGSDHAGFQLKNKIIELLKNKGIQTIDKGTYSEESCDYPDYAHAVAESIENKESELGIIMCGSGNGINIAANKHQQIRAALAWDVEIAKLARQHNDANVLSLPARFISEEKALQIVEAFLNETFEGGRHQKRIDKIGLKVKG